MKTETRRMRNWWVGALLLWQAFAPLAQAFYNPSTGKWLSRDPIEELGGLNLYAVVGNDPVQRFDPLGLDARSDCHKTCGDKFGRSGVGGARAYAACLIECNRKHPDYPLGFSLCQRDLQKDSSCDCPTMIGNALGGEHSYLQHVDSEGNKWGYGFAAGGTVSEKHFNPNDCKPCKKNGTLRAGSAAGKSASSATDAEIQDCIRSTKPSRTFSVWKYNCRSWAKEAAKNCGLDCN